jgi:hypothetical protein
MMAMSTVRATADTRYSFTAQFLRGGAIFARRAHEIEASASVSEELRSEHVACVVGAITQAAAALEAEIYEVLIHGPGHHLGSNGINATARAFLLPLAETIDGEPTLRRYELVLHLLQKPALDRGAHPYQIADLLIALRNLLIHYKSRWGEEMERPKVFARLQELKFDKPPFTSQGMNFFPHRCLSGSLASWSVTTGVDFINAFYSNLAVPSPLVAHAVHLIVPPTKSSVT